MSTWSNILRNYASPCYYQLHTCYHRLKIPQHNFTVFSFPVRNAFSSQWTPRLEHSIMFYGVFRGRMYNYSIHGETYSLYIHFLSCRYCVWRGGWTGEALVLRNVKVTVSKWNVNDGKPGIRKIQAVVSDNYKRVLLSLIASLTTVL